MHTLLWIVGILVVLFVLLLVIFRPNGSIGKQMRVTDLWKYKILGEVPNMQWFTLDELERMGYPHKETLDALLHMHLFGWLDVEPFKTIEKSALGPLWNGYEPEEVLELMREHGFARGVVKFYKMRLNAKAEKHKSERMQSEVP